MTLLEYAKWYLEEDNYFISERGDLLYCYPPNTKLEKVFGFRFYIQMPYDQLVKPHDTGRRIDIVPRYIVPIEEWENR